MKLSLATSALALSLAAPALAQAPADPGMPSEIPAEPPAEVPPAPPAEAPPPPAEQPPAPPAEEPPAPAEEPPPAPGEVPDDAPPADPGAPVEEPGAPGAPVEEPPAETPEVPGATGLATGAIGETFFIRTPQEYHLIASELPGMPVWLDTTTPVGQMSPAAPAEAAGTVDEEIRAGRQPLGTITDVLIDRTGGAAGLIVELDPEMRGGAREIAVAMGLVRMLPGRDDPYETVVLLSLDPVDLENAPNFERTGAPGAEAAD